MIRVPADAGGTALTLRPRRTAPPAREVNARSNPRRILRPDVENRRWRLCRVEIGKSKLMMVICRLRQSFET